MYPFAIRKEQSNMQCFNKNHLFRSRLIRVNSPEGNNHNPTFILDAPGETDTVIRTSRKKQKKFACSLCVVAYSHFGFSIDTLHLLYFLWWLWSFVLTLMCSRMKRRTYILVRMPSSAPFSEWNCCTGFFSLINDWTVPVYWVTTAFIIFFAWMILYRRVTVIHLSQDHDVYSFFVGNSACVFLQVNISPPKGKNYFL